MADEKEVYYLIVHSYPLIIDYICLSEETATKLAILDDKIMKFKGGVREWVVG